MLKILFTHYFKSLFRSTRFDVKLVLKILMVFSLLYLCLLIFLTGISFEDIINEFKPFADPVRVFNEFLFYLIPIDCLLRFFFQKNNLHPLSAYMHLPIHRGKIISFILLTRLFNFFNLYLLLFIVPFSWVNIFPDYGWFVFSLYLVSILLIMIFLTYFTFLIKNLSYNHFLFCLFPGFWVLIVFMSKFISHTNPGIYTGDLFNEILTGNYLPVILFAFLTATITFVNISLIKHFFYNVLADPEKKRIKIKIPKNLLPARFSNAYILLEMRLMARNKRIRSILILPVYFTLLTYIVFLIKPDNDVFLILFWYLCLSGIWGYSYLQIVFSLESSFFDFLATSYFDFCEYFRSKYILIVLISFLLMLVALPLVVIRNQNIHIIATALLYNIGIGYFIVFLTGIFNRERIDLNRGLLFNYQALNTIQIVSMSLVLILPLALFWIITLILKATAALVAINIISVISLLSYKGWFQMIYKQLLKRKYINLEGYRK